MIIFLATVVIATGWWGMTLTGTEQAIIAIGFCDFFLSGQSEITDFHDFLRPHHAVPTSYVPMDQFLHVHIRQTLSNIECHTGQR